MIITSINNETIKSIKKLNEKKYRDKENKYIIEGIKIVEEAYKTKQQFSYVIICEEILNKTSIDKTYITYLINQESNKVIYVSEKVFKYLTDTITPQGILAVLEKNNNIDKFINNNILFLDRVQDSGNLGTIIRTAKAFGFNNIILNEGCADPYNSKVLRSTMGNIFSINLSILNDNGVDILERLKDDGYSIYLATLKDSTEISKVKFKDKKVIVMGNEANGISAEILNISENKILIPMENDTESLNVAIATAIILYESKKYK